MWREEAERRTLYQAVKVDKLKIGLNAIFLVSGRGGGIERYLRNLITALGRIDQVHEYVLFTNIDNAGTFDLPRNFRECPSPVSARIRPMKILWEQMVLPFQVKSAGIDVLLSPGNICPLFCPCPSLVVIHDMVPFVRPEDFSLMEKGTMKGLIRLSSRRALKIITDSRSSERQIRALLHVAPEKTVMIYPGCDEGFLHYRHSLQEEAMLRRDMHIKGDYLLYTASTRPYKNTGRLIQAFRILRDRYGVRQSLVITGIPGRDQGSLEELAGVLGLCNDTVFTGYVNERYLPALYAGASVFVYPSLYEGFGLPVLEAMACGTPVAAAMSTSLPEVVGDAGVLFDPYDPEDMAEKIRRIIAEEGLRTRLIRKGRERVLDFSWARAAEEMLLQMKRVVAQKGADQE